MQSAQHKRHEHVNVEYWGRSVSEGAYGVLLNNGSKEGTPSKFALSNECSQQFLTARLTQLCDSRS